MKDKNKELVRYNFDMIKGVLDQIGLGAYSIKFVNFNIKTKEIPMSISSLYMDDIAVASLSVGRNILDDFSNNSFPDSIFDIVSFTDTLRASLFYMSGKKHSGYIIFETYLKPLDTKSNIIGYCKVEVDECTTQDVIFFTKLNSNDSVDIYLPRAMLDNTDLCREFLHSDIYICKCKLK